MTTATAPSIAYLACALNVEGGAAVPEWIELLPAGERVAGYDGRAWINDRPQELVARFARRPSPLPIDFEHGTEGEPDGRAKDIAGHVVGLEVRDGGAVWGRVEWSDLGANKVSTRQYRHVSPAFFFDRKGGRIHELTSVALTVNPNLSLAALNRRSDPPCSKNEALMNVETRKALCRKLGLADEASDTAILDAVTRIEDEKDKALNAAKTPDLGQFVPRADHDKVKADLEIARNTLKAREDEDVVALVDGAVAAGKITPASRDYHLAACRSGPEGRSAFKTFIGSAPTTDLARDSGLAAADPEQGKATLSADEKKIARQLGLSEDEFAKDLAARRTGRTEGEAA